MKRRAWRECVGEASRGFSKEPCKNLASAWQNFGKESFFMFFLVLIQERTKENQGRKARPDGFPGGGTTTRHNSPRLRRGSNSAAWAFPRYVPPPTHLRVRLLCHFTNTSNVQRFTPLRALRKIPFSVSELFRTSWSMRRLDETRGLTPIGK